MELVCRREEGKVEGFLNSVFPFLNFAQVKMIRCLCSAECIDHDILNSSNLDTLHNSTLDVHKLFASTLLKCIHRRNPQFLLPSDST